MDKLPFDIEDRFFRFSNYLSDKFGSKAQKLSINAGFSCPNLDGTISSDGCIYCNNEGFKPQYCQASISIEDQINQGIVFFERKRNYKYLAYFQSYTNTHTSPENLRSVLQQAIHHERIVGVIVSTRPDCVSRPIIDVLREASEIKPLMLEFGVESTNNQTLKMLRRGHSYEQVYESVINCTNAGIDVGVHIILGLPGETREQIVNHATEISKLPINSIKLHQLQIVKNTKLAEMYASNPASIPLMGWNEYVELCCDFVEHLRPDIAIERFASQTAPDLLAVQNWDGVRNHHITHLVQNRLTARLSYQGRLWK